MTIYSCFCKICIAQGRILITFPLIVALWVSLIGLFIHYVGVLLRNPVVNAFFSSIDHPLIFVFSAVIFGSWLGLLIIMLFPSILE
jgi:hypothetical protein